MWGNRDAYAAITLHRLEVYTSNILFEKYYLLL